MIIPVISAASAVTLYLVMLNTNAFGSLYQVPDADDVAKVYIHTPVDNMKHFPENGAPYPTLCTDTESIKQVCELNTMLNEDLRSSSEDGSSLDNYNANFPDRAAFRSELDLPNQPIYAGDDNFVITYCMKNGKVYEKVIIPCVTDYTTSEIFKTEITELTENMEHTHQVVVDSLDEKKFRVCFGTTDFMERLYGKRFHSYVACNDPYPREYVATEFDSDLLKEILYASYYPVYYSTEDCYVFYIDTYNEKNGEYYQNTLKYFLPAEYSDLYEQFIKTSNARKVKWYTTDENGNKISVNT